MNSHKFRIYVECHNDELFARKIGFGRKKIRHAKGKMNIFKVFSRPISQGIVHIGLIDADPHAPRVSELDEKYERIDNLENGDLVLYKQRDNNYFYLIEISPRLEQWLVKCFRESGIQNRLDATNPDDLATMLHEIRMEKNAKANKMIDELMSSGNREIEKIKEWIRNILGDVV